jgi:hypothetical protein
MNTKRGELQAAQDRTVVVERSDGHPWGDPAAISGEFRWPPMGKFPWPPSHAVTKPHRAPMPEGPGFPRIRVHANPRRRPDPRPRFHAPGGLSATSGRALLFANLGHLRGIGAKVPMTVDLASPGFVRKEEPVLARIELTPTAPFDEEQPSSSPVPASLLCR